MPPIMNTLFMIFQKLSRLCLRDLYTNLHQTTYKCPPPELILGPNLFNLLKDAETGSA